MPSCGPHKIYFGGGGAGILIPCNDFLMIERIKLLLSKYYDVISYLFFGVLTTVVNYLVYLPCYNLLGFPAVISNLIAWVVAVAFAYLTNKPFVFKSHDWSAQTVVPEILKFVGCRIGSGVLETGLLALTVDWLGWNGIVMKIVASAMVVILNYIGSKWLVFHQ